MNKRSQELCKLRDLCALELPATLLIPAFLEALHGLIPSCRNLFDWCDAQGRLTQYFIEGTVDLAIAKLYFDEFHNRREAEVMLPFAHAVGGNASIHSAAALNTRAFFNSSLYWDIWRPQGFRYRVEAIVRSAKGSALGSLVLYRGPGERCFKAAEEALLPQVLPYLSHALNRKHDAPAADAAALWTASADPPETLLADASGAIQHASAGAARFLLLAKAGPGVASMEAQAQFSQHPALLGLQKALSQTDKASCRHQSHWGLFEFTAQRLKACRPDAQASQELIQIQIRRFEPQALAHERKLLALDLSPGQTSVCRLLLQGKSHVEVAQQLGVASSTVVDHTRKLYKALQVRSVQELATRVWTS